ncbi:MAG TPA: hypothetical protein VFF11_03000, partial [Candidatus Binatia bacterium]|nr:hypothetical protein [Candidatus Binatia bacterium]
ALAAWDAANPIEIFTEWVIEPWPGDGIPRITLKHILADELDQWEPAEATLKNGKPMTVLVRKGEPNVQRSNLEQVSTY